MESLHGNTLGVSLMVQSYMLRLYDYLVIFYNFAERSCLARTLKCAPFMSASNFSGVRCVVAVRVIKTKQGLELVPPPLIL